MEVPLLEIDLPSEFEQRLDALAKKTGQSKGALARETSCATLRALRIMIAIREMSPDRDIT